MFELLKKQIDARNWKKHIKAVGPNQALFDAEPAKQITMALNAGGDINARDKDGWTPLMCAAIDGNTEMVKNLIDLGADVNARDNNGKTPLHCLWDVESGQLLIEHGADVNARDNDGETLIHFQIIFFILILYIITEKYSISFIFISL